VTAVYESRPSPTASFWLLIAIISLIGVSKAVNTPLDPDLFWHLRVAEQLQHEGIHPLVDHISFMSTRDPWTPYSWLAELGMKFVWDHFGYRGTIAAQAITNAGIIVMIALGCLSLAGKGRLLSCAVATALAAYLSLPYLSFRPATIAIFLLAVCAWLLLRDRELDERSRAVWWTIPITALLANVHLTVVMMPLWVGCLLLGDIVEKRGRARRYLLLLIGCTLACVATPMCAGMFRTMWHYQFHDAMVASGLITEMQPLYAGIGGIVTIVVLNALTIWAMVHRHRVRVGEWLWFFAAAALMIRLGRFVPLFAIIAAPVLATALGPLSDAALRKKPMTIALFALFIICAGKLIYLFPKSPQMNDFLTRDETFRYPTAAADYIDHNIQPRSGRIVNEFTWGGYLAWRLGSHFQVFVDGRTQL